MESNKPDMGFRLPMWLYVCSCILQINIFELSWVELILQCVWESECILFSCLVLSIVLKVYFNWWSLPPVRVEAQLGLQARVRNQGRLENLSHVVPKTGFQDGGDRTQIFTERNYHFGLVYDKIYPRVSGYRHHNSVRSRIWKQLVRRTSSPKNSLVLMLT